MSLRRRKMLVEGRIRGVALSRSLAGRQARLQSTETALAGAWAQIFIGDVHRCAAEPKKCSRASPSIRTTSLLRRDLLTAAASHVRGRRQLFRQAARSLSVGNHRQRLLAARHARMRGEGWNEARA